MPQWCQRLLNRRLAHRSPQKVLADQTRRKHNRGYSRWTTRDFASSTAEMPPSLGIGNASAWECPNPHDGSFRTECLPLLYGRPLRYLLVIVTAYSKNNITSCFVMNIGCASRGPTIHVVCGDLSFFIVTLPLCCCVRCTSSCVRTLREGCRHDGPLSPYVHAVEPFVLLLFA
ncbi:trans-sialidase, partial [Trypanosoma cruzi]